MSTNQNASSSQPHLEGELEEYDLVIIGSGVGSKLAAWTLAGQGLNWPKRQML